jgi:hypothetical protein
VVAVAAYDGSTSKRRRSPRAREQAAASSFKHEKLLFKSRGFKAKGKKKKKKKKRQKKKKKKARKHEKKGGTRLAARAARALVQTNSTYLLPK